MNKMNLPPPFEELDDEFPTLKEVYDVENYQDIFGRMSTETEDVNGKLPKFSIFQCSRLSHIFSSFSEDEEESEMESDDDQSKPEIIPVKRRLPQPKKRLKIPKFVNPMNQFAPTTSGHKSMRPEDVFESMKLDSKNMKIDLKNVEKLADPESNKSESNLNDTVEGGFGLIFPGDIEEEKMAKIEEKREFITSEELSANRISANGN